jgi:hypothetical protein
MSTLLTHGDLVLDYILKILANVNYIHTRYRAAG